MVAMGRALMMDPSVLLLDEPSAGLSPAYQDEVFIRCRRINATGVSIIMVEQNARRCLQICDRGYVLDQGRNAYTDTGRVADARPQGHRALPGHARQGAVAPRRSARRSAGSPRGAGASSSVERRARRAGTCARCRREGQRSADRRARRGPDSTVPGSTVPGQHSGPDSTVARTAQWPGTEIGAGPLPVRRGRCRITGPRGQPWINAAGPMPCSFRPWMILRRTPRTR